MLRWQFIDLFFFWRKRLKHLCSVRFFSIHNVFFAALMSPFQTAEWCFVFDFDEIFDPQFRTISHSKRISHARSISHWSSPGGIVFNWCIVCTINVVFCVKYLGAYRTVSRSIVWVRKCPTNQCIQCFSYTFVTHRFKIAFFFVFVKKYILTLVILLTLLKTLSVSCDLWLIVWYSTEFIDE